MRNDDATATNRVADRTRSGSGQGLRFERHFTKAGQDPFETVAWERRTARITNPDGSVVFEMADIEVPKPWSQLATDIVASKYFRKGGVPGSGHETSVRQVIGRVVEAIVLAGIRLGGYFASEEDSRVFRDELAYMLIHQMGAPNSPVWFNCGLKEAYGIAGDPAGNWCWDPETNSIVQATDGYTRPQISACFIVTVDDDLMDIASHVQREMRIFKYGGGAGSNYSHIRGEGEKLSGGGTSSGVMSFLKVFDVAAGAIKSGGVTRRAAKMVVLDADHPDIEKFVEWKAREEDKARMLIAAGLPSDFNGEAYQTISGQNANNSVSVTDEFMRAVAEDGDWSTRWRKDGKVAKTLKARGLFRKIAKAAWECADPGLQFSSTINKWHTVPNSGPIRSSNPCSEYFSLDNTSCNLASLNLMKFMARRDRGLEFDIRAYAHACRTFITAMEIIVDHASYPTKEIAQNTHDYRQLGLGYANLGTALMTQGIPYDSEDGRAFAAAVTALMAATAYATSSEIAASKGPFPGFAHNRPEMLNVMRMHRDAADAVKRGRHAAIVDGARAAWADAVAKGEQWGYRNSQSVVIAPTGTIGLLMDCDTTGVEPDFSLVKHKKLAGGGAMKIVNKSVESALETLGYGLEARKAIVAHLETTGAVEGAPGLDPANCAVFDCAVAPTKAGRVIEPMGHVRMVAAIQPFLSGSASKTINMPETTSIEEIEKVYVEAWKLGLKCISVYRDNCKASQPLSAGGKKDEKKAEAPKVVRRRLPKKRRGFTQEARVGGHKVYVRTGEYETGEIGEIFIDTSKDGASFRSMTNCLAIATSIGLQHGVPLEEFVDAFTYVKFEPAGPVDHPNIRNATSIVDYVFRVLGLEYLGMNDLAQVPPESPTDLAHEPEDEPHEKAPAPATVTTSTAAPTATITTHTNGNGNGNGHKNGAPKKVMKGDAQFCPTCGDVVVRNGRCALCRSCGSTTGCS